MIDRLTHDDFAPLLDADFRVSAEGIGPFSMKLIEVAPTGGTQLERTPFSIVFKAAPEISLPQRIYRVEHERMATMDLFLVPLGPVKDGFRYEAVFT